MDSQSIFEAAQKDVKHWNAFAYPERLNPPTDVRVKESGGKCLGNLGKPFSISFPE